MTAVSAAKRCPRDNVLRQQVRQVLDLNAVLHASNNLDLWIRCPDPFELTRDNNYRRRKKALGVPPTTIGPGRQDGARLHAASVKSEKIIWEFLQECWSGLYTFFWL
ncbi:hypothetical protein KM043_016571 [Ampulex compressa]|nr:hypothetical protein KM043_016571 [Ampulex compressa]